VKRVSYAMVADRQEGRSAEWVDALAHEGLAAAAPFRFRNARSAAERDAMFRLRYLTALERGWARPDEFPDGVERDPDDERAVHVVAFDGEVLAATGRLVLPASGQLLPAERAFGITIEPVGRVADVGRFVVARAYSGVRHRLMAALLASVWLEARARGYSTISGAFVSPAEGRLYRRMGFQLRPLAPPAWHWGEWRYPIRFDVASSVATLSAYWGDEPGPAEGR
jgi:N-acyl-L-homoserine lactone synthetase